MRALRPLTFTVLLLTLCASAGAPRAAARAGCLTGAVASVHPLATEAGMRALAAGGNAIDAAVTTALTLGVVDSHNSGIGGGCFMLVRRADGTVLAIDGREKAPARASRDMFVRDGEVVPELSLTGALASGVPGSLAAYAYALRHAGRRSLAAALAPGARLAACGAPVSTALAARLEKTQEDLARFPAARAIFLDAEGAPWPEGHVLRQPDLARTYRAIARCGIRWFYCGPFACALDRWMRAHGGLLTASDFGRYRLRLRQPVRSSYRGYELLGFPPPSSGGVHVAQILRILEAFDLRALHEEDRAKRWHVMAEAMKLAFADRAHWLGDPDFVAVPRGLTDPAYCATLAERIDLEGVTPVEDHGQPPNAETDVFGSHTTHIAAADSQGNWVAITTTLNTSFGSKVVVPGTGVLLNNQMDDFSARPGEPNTFGLVGAEANKIAPDKRPLSSMSPTIVLEDGKPFLTLGAAGGPKIITQVVQALVNHIDFGRSLRDAVAAPRLHHQWKPDTLFVGPAFPEQARARLRALGHRIEEKEAMGITQAILQRPDGRFVAVSDPRVPGAPAGRARNSSR